MHRVLLALLFSVTAVQAQRALPETIDSCPVSLSLSSTNGASWGGSGFYFSDTNFVYLVTAKHVLFQPPLNTNMAATAEGLSYHKYDDTNSIVRSFSIATLLKDGNIRLHPKHNVMKRTVRLMGVVSQFVSITDQKQSSLYGTTTEIDITNSGYSVIEPIDYVLELLWDK